MGWAAARSRAGVPGHAWFWYRRRASEMGGGMARRRGTRIGVSVALRRSKHPVGPCPGGPIRTCTAAFLPTQLNSAARRPRRWLRALARRQGWPSERGGLRKRNQDQELLVGQASPHAEGGSDACRRHGSPRLAASTGAIHSGVAVVSTARARISTLASYYVFFSSYFPFWRRGGALRVPWARGTTPANQRPGPVRIGQPARGPLQGQAS